MSTRHQDQVPKPSTKHQNQVPEPSAKTKYGKEPEEKLLRFFFWILGMRSVFLESNFTAIQTAKAGMAG